MSYRIEDLKNGKVEKVNTLEVKILKIVSKVHYIVGDETSHTLLESDQYLKEGSAYKLIKPSYGYSKLRKNPKFAAIKVERKMRTKELIAEDEQVLIGSIKHDEKKASHKIFSDFGSVEAQGVGSITEEITLMVVSKSRVINGKYGIYRIVDCKDVKNQKNSVNLYKSLQNVVEVGEVYIFTKLKVNNFKKEDQDFHRIATTHASRILNEGKQGQDEFKKAGVMIGDKGINGTIIGISELIVYKSCRTCWCKVDDESFCRMCNQIVETIKKISRR